MKNLWTPTKELKMENATSVSKEEIVSSLKNSKPRLLFDRAKEVCARFFGNEVHLRGIIEFSNRCEKNCFYCGLRKSNKKITRYQMTPCEIVAAAENAGRLGYKTIILQSGEENDISVRSLCKIVEQIKKKVDCAITLSVGEKSREDYLAFRQAGADRYLLKFETSNQKLFKKLKPDSLFEKRMGCLYILKELGYQVGSGCMVGLPGQTEEDLADDLLFIQKFGFDMCGIGPFIPHPETPLSKSEKGTVQMTLKMIAWARILTRTCHLPATTALGTIDAQSRTNALNCGANVLMVNVTPVQYKELYEIYPNRICTSETLEQTHSALLRKLKIAGKKISTDYGHSYSNEEEYL